MARACAIVPSVTTKLGKNPPAVKEVSALIPVTKDTVDEFAKNWVKWLPR